MQRALRTFGLCAAFLCGCVEASPSETSTGTGGGGGMNGVVDSGTGGSGGTSATGGTGGAEPPEPVTCGSAACTTPFDAMFADLPESLRDMLPRACCVDSATDSCGIRYMGGACIAPPPVDDRCPAVGVGATAASPCCTATGMCGLDLSPVGMGCVDLGSPLFEQAGAAIPAPRRCDGTAFEEDGGLEEDGGAE